MHSTTKKANGNNYSNGHLKQILIVDDDEGIVRLLTECLVDDYDCATAASAEEALAKFRVNEFQLVISDILMPGMTGLDLLAQLKTIAPKTVVVMISGVQTVESAINALRLGAFDYLVKPFNLQNVEAVVKRSLEHYDLVTAKLLYEYQLEELVKQRTAELGDALVSLEDAYRSTLRALTTALETRDLETHGHSERVVSFSLRLGREFGLEGPQMKALEFGALLHDIGKIGVPDSILRKPAKLTEDEWILMREHPAHGKQIIKGIKFLEGAARVVAQHHERWNGTGYPQKLRGADIDVCARIFSVVDAFDAITSDRPYRRGRSYEDAVRELEQHSGSQFDAEVVSAFKRVPAAEWEEIRKLTILNSAAAYKPVKIQLLYGDNLSNVLHSRINSLIHRPL